MTDTPDNRSLVERLRQNDAEIYLPLLGEAADVVDELVAALRGGERALNSYYSQAQAEYHGNDKTAERHDDIVRAWRTQARAALAKVQP